MNMQAEASDGPPRMSRLELGGLLVVVCVATILRVSLALVNRQANDNHYEVIALLMDGLRHLDMTDCHECFHPKLYHATCALSLNLLRVEDRGTGIVIAQMFNVLAGLGTLWLIWLHLKTIAINSWLRLAAFSLVALNPRLIGINGQATNDSFAILFSTWAILSTFRYLRCPRLADFIQIEVAIVLAMLSKGTVWPAAIAIVISVFARAVFHADKRVLTASAGAATIAIALATIYAGDYDFENYDNYANLGKEQPLYWLEPTVVGRPGVTSIVDSYLTFRLVDLVQNPMITNGLPLVPLHRSSLWSQLYGRTHFIQFDNHPHSWRSNDSTVLNVGRAILLVALPFSVLWVYGMAVFVREFCWAVLRWNKQYLGDPQRYLDLIIAAGYFCFIMLFAYNYRDFAAMKVIYIFPGIIAFTTVFCRGCEAINSRWMRGVFTGALIVLLLLYAIDVELLIRHLEVI